ncbi:hypothetical protein GCM10018785_14890 [Streptomyces longispororuber]|uniref:Uncharacterized protein n=1 Tax=Streptomyces longispororuber TaxID=68230 RepID=A0A918ZDV1_9ACTN|nr:hypothetical protein GCM10018785_14890 [Streptomyces longispororuber]
MVVPLPPARSDLAGAFQDHGRDTGAAQQRRGRQTAGSGADDDGVVVALTRGSFRCVRGHSRYNEALGGEVTAARNREGAPVRDRLSD